MGLAFRRWSLIIGGGVLGVAGCGASVPEDGGEIRVPEAPSRESVHEATTTVFSDVTVRAALRVDRAKRSIPPSFLGLSQEWPWLGSLTGNPSIRAMMKQLASYDTGPLNLRIGGASADKQGTVPVPSVWEGLRRLHEDLGVQYILGLNLAANDAGLAKRQFEAARQALPSGAIVSFEIGNEPNYYWQEGYRSTQDWLSGYPDQFARFGQHIACGASPCRAPLFAGPVWGHIFVEPEKLGWILSKTSHVLNLVTVHFYKDTKETPNDPVSLLDEPPLAKAMDSLEAQVNKAREYRLPLRVAESNTISNGGRLGVSDTFSAALWALDASFEMASRGAVGVNYHQASNYAFFEIDKATSGESVAYPRPVYFGYLLFQKAVAGGGELLEAQVQGSRPVKVWPVRRGNEVRVTLVNKGPTPEVVRVELDGAGYGDGDVVRLSAPRLDAKKGVVLAGQTYDSVGAVPTGAYRTESVRVQREAPGSTFDVQLPPFSAALLTTRK